MSGEITGLSRLETHPSRTWVYEGRKEDSLRTFSNKMTAMARLYRLTQTLQMDIHTTYAAWNWSWQECLREEGLISLYWKFKTTGPRQEHNKNCQRSERSSCEERKISSSKDRHSENAMKKENKMQERPCVAATKEERWPGVGTRKKDNVTAKQVEAPEESKESYVKIEKAARQWRRC
jgi:hypothetical protein